MIRGYRFYGETIRVTSKKSNEVMHCFHIDKIGSHNFWPQKDGECIHYNMTNHIDMMTILYSDNKDKLKQIENIRNQNKIYNERSGHLQENL